MYILKQNEELIWYKWCVMEIQSESVSSGSLEQRDGHVHLQDEEIWYTKHKMLSRHIVPLATPETWCAKLQTWSTLNEKELVVFKNIFNSALKCWLSAFAVLLFTYNLLKS